MAHTNQSTLTAGFCRNNRLVFYPKTVGEAVFIQERLAAFGVRWGNKPVGALAQECVSTGMLVDEGILYHNPTSDSRNILCTADQFDTNYIPPDRAFLLEQFNKMAERIDTLSSRVVQLEQKVGEMHEALFPRIDDTKPRLKKPDMPGGTP